MCLESPLEAGPVINETEGLTFSYNVGDSASLVCTADGNPAPQIMWMKNGAYLPIELYPEVVETREVLQPGIREGLDAVRSTLTFTSLIEMDAGDYQCRASNEIGTPTFLHLSLEVNVEGIVQTTMCICAKPVG